MWTLIMKMLLTESLQLSNKWHPDSVALNDDKMQNLFS
jgi:hypothetical protein